MTDTRSDPFDDLVAEAAEPDKPDVRVVEETLLAGCLTSPEVALKVVGETRPEDFFYTAHRRFADLVFPDLLEGRHIDRLTLGRKVAADSKPEELQTVVDRIFAQVETAPPTLGKVEAYLTGFVEDARRRLAKHLVKKVGDTLDRGDLSPEAAAAQVFKIATDLDAARRLTGTFKSEAEAWPAYMAALEAAQDPAHDFLGLDTVFPHLNYVANGLMPGLFILGAAPSTGKTTFVKQLADQVVEANPDAACLFVSLEQSREELRVKTLSRLSGVENRDILRGRLDRSSIGWKAVKDAAEAYHGAVADRFFVVEGDKTTTPDRIRLAALQVKRATQTARLLVVVDYLQIVPTEDQYKDPRTKVDAVVSDLRRLARDLDAAVVAVSSIGREWYKTGTGNRPGIAAFKESGGVEYGADLGGVMWQDKGDPKGDKTFKGIAGRQWKRLRLDVVKNRNGEKARIEYDFFPQVSAFVEQNKSSLPDEEPEA